MDEEEFGLGGTGGTEINADDEFANEQKSWAYNDPLDPLYDSTLTDSGDQPIPQAATRTDPAQTAVVTDAYISKTASSSASQNPGPSKEQETKVNGTTAAAPLTGNETNTKPLPHSNDAAAAAVTAADKKALRAARFNIPPKEETKLALRAERFGIKKTSESEGAPESSDAERLKKLQQRAQRFGTANKDDSSKPAAGGVSSKNTIEVLW